MIDFIEACELAYTFFKNEIGKDGLRKVYEANTLWIFYAGLEGEIGELGITVNKKTSELADFLLPSRENLALLNNSIELDVPKKFRIS